MKMRKAARLAGRICSGAVTAVLAVLLAANLYVLAAQRLGTEDPAVLGLRSAVVLTGSMSGTIEPDDLVVTHEEASYDAGDIIMFRSGSHTVTHRITAVTAEGYRTRGDANNTEDAAVTPPEDVLGFMKSPRSGFKLTGCWKVYGDAERARLTFEKFRKCTNIYTALWKHGSSLERLAVAG